MHFSSTDLPVPDPPMITMLCPRRCVRSTPRSTRLAPKALVDVAQLDHEVKNTSVST